MAFVLLSLTGCGLGGPHPVKEKEIVATVAKYEPTPSQFTDATPHYVMPDRACTFVDSKGVVTRVYCVDQITDAADGEAFQLDSCNIDKACIRALEHGDKCKATP